MSRAVLAQRFLVAIAAAALIVWFAVSLADKHALANGQKASHVVFQRHASAAERAAGLRRAIADTRSAESLHPGDHAPLSLRLYIYVFAGRKRRALAAAEELIKAEPRNRLGWTALPNLDPHRAAQASARLRALSPDPRRRP